MTQITAAPVGQVWFLRDAVPGVRFEKFRLDQSGGANKTRIDQVKGELFARGGQAAWHAAESQAREQLRVGLTISIPSIIQSVGPPPVPLAKIGECINFTQAAHLDIFFQGKEIGSLDYSIVAKITLLEAIGSRYRARIDLGLTGLGEDLAQLPSFEGWIATV